MVRNHRTANRKRHIVGMKGLVFLAAEILPREHILVIKIIRCRTVVLVRARPRGEDGLQPPGAAVLTWPVGPFALLGVAFPMFITPSVS